MHGHKHIPGTYYFVQHIRIWGAMKIFLKKNNAIIVFVFKQNSYIIENGGIFWKCSFSHNSCFLLFHLLWPTLPIHLSPFPSYNTHLQLSKKRRGGVSFTYFDRNLEHNLSMNVLYISLTKRAIGTETKDLWKKRGIRMYNNLIFLNFYFLKHRLLIQYTF